MLAQMKSFTGTQDCSAISQRFYNDPTEQYLHCYLKWVQHALSSHYDLLRLLLHRK